MDTSVYVHFPWCLSKCPYCDFATRAVEPHEVLHDAYADALGRELDARAAGLEGRRLVSVFFGGGTPSLWDPAALGRVLHRIHRAFPDRAPDVEVTVECNPSSFDRRRAAALREAGVDRISLGVQSLNDERLRFLGRRHDAPMALRALRDGVAEMPRVSGDLMFGMPGQTEGDLADEARQLLALGIEHVSAYALTLEPGTLFGELHRRGRLQVADDDTYADLFETLARVFDEAGWAHYEVSNYALPGREARHNLHYWRGGDYVGIGAAAVGCLASAPGRARRWRNRSSPQRYLEAAGADGTEEWSEELGPEDLVREAIMLGLRTRTGMDLDATAARAGRDPLTGRETAVERAMARGNLVREGTRLWVPEARWLGLDSIVADLF